MMEAVIIYWYLFNPDKYNRYRSLLNYQYSKEEAYNRIKNEDT